jgi:Ca2+-dependent lipid-binding protein
MDPFIKVTLDGEIQKTETALNQGKTPVWKNPLKFRLSDRQLSQPDTVIFNIEAFDEDSKTKENFLGSCAYKLSQIKGRPGEIITIQLNDKKNKIAGTIEVEFELVNEGLQTQGSMMTNFDASKPAYLQRNFQKHVVGTVVIKPTQGRFETSVHDTDEFYIVLSHGDVIYQSMVSEGSGRTPIFRDIVSFQLFDGEDMTVKIFNNDLDRNDLLGEGFLQLTSLVKKGTNHVIPVSLSSGNRRVGEINFEIEFYPEIFDSLVKVYPTISVKRNDFITKKIRYSNPDRFRKNLTIRSDNKDLVFIKTESVTIQPGEFAEIRFKISAPLRLPEERCRVDIIVDDTRAIEESLLFKVKSI